MIFSCEGSGFILQQIKRTLHHFKRVYFLYTVFSDVIRIMERLLVCIALCMYVEEVVSALDPDEDGKGPTEAAIPVGYSIECFIHA